MLTAIEVMQRMLIEELAEIRFFANYVLSRGDKNPIRLQNAERLSTGAIKIAGVMQDRSRECNVKSAIAKG